MTMYNLLIILLTNLLRLFVIRRFMRIFFETRFIKRKYEISAYTIFYASTSLFYLMFHLPLLNMAVNLLATFYITLIFEGSLKKKAFVTFLVYIINMVCDIISAFSFSQYNVNSKDYAVFEILTVLLILVCELIVEKIVTVKTNLEYRVPYLFVLLLIPSTSIVMLNFIISHCSNSLIIIFTSCGILIINIIVFYLYNAIAETYKQKYESEILKQQLKVFQNQLEVIMQSQEKIRSLKHDMKHHIKELTFMAKECETNQISEYLNKMQEFMDNPDEYVYSGNMDTDGIINYMIQKAKKTLKDVKVKICIPEHMNTHSFDLNVILGNLLENSIEAASFTDKKILYFNMEMEKGIIYIRISNSYNGNILVNQNKFLTTKKDKAEHGIGLRNVKKIVELYDGTLDISYEKDMFIVDVMLYTEKLK